VIIDNKPGGSATLGPATMAGTAKPDGYTIGQIAIPVFRVPYMQKATFRSGQGFHLHHPHGRLQSRCGRESRRSVQEVAGRHRFRQGQSGKFTYTTIGAATTNAIAMELMARQSGVQFTHIPSKGEESRLPPSSAATSWRWWNRRSGARWSTRVSCAC
jgi:tripartite-type tricarboxylate transporter receptor subunit TctC